MIKLNLTLFGGNGSGDGTLAADRYETKLSREIGRRSQIRAGQSFVLHNFTEDKKSKVSGDYLLEQIKKRKLRKEKGTWRGSKGAFYTIRRIEKRRKR